MTLPWLGLPLRRALTAAAAAAAAGCFAVMDADPVLFLADCWWASSLYRQLLRQRQQHRKLQGQQRQQERIWIIGASTGIGEELAYQFAVDSNNYSNNHSDPSSPLSSLHLILSSRSKEKLKAVAQTCRELSNERTTVTVLPLDVCQDDDLERAVKQISSQHQDPQRYRSCLDAVVLNAGGGHLSPALETSSQTAQAVWRLNAHWPMVLVPLLFRYKLFGDDCSDSSSNNGNKLHRRPPHLVVTSSIAGIMPVPLSATYAAAKHALQGYFRSLAAERPDLRLHLVLPGPIDTDFHRNNKSATSSLVVDQMKRDDHKPTSKLKMPVQRCARLVRSTMKFSRSRESWIARQPTLAALYLQALLPQQWMHCLVYSRIGPKRVALHRAGLDLYDPASWATATTTTTTTTTSENTVSNGNDENDKKDDSSISSSE